jgi:hypothetical protein
MANAEIKVNNVIIPDVLTSSFPNYGSIRFSIVVGKTVGQDEYLSVPVLVNGVKVSSIDVNMKASEVSRIVAANVTLPGASLLMINPFANPTPIASNVSYAKYPNSYLNPISSIQYEIQVGNFKKNATLLVYADWSFWAIIIDIVLIVVTVFVLRRFILT